MPRKNIYIRDDDIEFFEKAIKALGEDEAIGTVIINALKEKLGNLPEKRERIFKLQLLNQLNSPAINEIIKYRLQNYPENLVYEAEVKAIYAYLGNPDHFSFPVYGNYDSYYTEWLLPFMEESLDSLINRNKIWFEKAKSYIEKGKKIHEESKKELDEEIEDNE